MFKANPEIQKKVEEIRKDSDTVDWIATITSESAKINYEKHLAEYLIYRKSTIQELIADFKKDENKEIKNVQAFANEMLQRLAGGTVANYVSAIKSRMQYDGIPFTRPIKIPNRTYHPTVENEIVPTKDQILSFLTNGKHATQVIISLIAFTGFRFNVIADLRIKDFPEMRITENNKVIFEKMPTRVKVRKELSKNGKAYQTFLIETGCMTVKNSLEVRMTKGEKLDSESLLVPTECEKTTVRQRAKAVSRRLNTVFEKVEYGSRPYSLKNFFATALLNSGLEQNLQTFYMGHTGPVQNVYSVQRQQPTEQIEKMRVVFKEKIEPNLIPQEGNADASVKKGFRKFAESLGIEVKEDANTDETIAEIAQIYKAGKDDISRRETTSNPFKQKSISESEIDQFLADDWEIAHVLPSGRIIVKKIVSV
ncbi:MAG: site-specific integrase [Nitrosopumilus sp.]|nr:site-specific integrase [Nitrosopumilus sp.]